MTTLDTLEKNIWQQDSKKLWVKSARILLGVIRIVMQSRIQLFSNSLTFHTLLAIVPLLAVLFTLLKSFGIEKFLQGIVNDVLQPMGDTGKEVGNYLYHFIDNAQAGFLGGIGLLFLFYTIFKLFNKIELTLNDLWCIDETRSFKDQLLGYVSIIMFTVIIAAAALALNVFVSKGILQKEWINAPIMADTVAIMLKVLSVIITAFMIAVLYIGAINTDVHLRSAFVGGLFCAILWIPLTDIFAQIMSASSSYSVIYSSFAGLVILLIWLNILWLLFLSGGLVAYFMQFPALLRPYATTKLNPTEMEHYADIILSAIIKNFNDKQGATSLSDIIKISGISHQQILELLAPFLQQNLIIRVGKTGTDFLPAVNPQELGHEIIRNIVRGEVR